MSDHRLAVVVLTWNGREDTVACIRSLLEFGPADQTIILVDNHSSDDTIEAVRQLSEEVLIVELDNNTGFSKGNNAGIELALRLGVGVIGVLNNDTVVQPGFAEPLVDAIRTSLRPLAVSPKIVYRDRPEKAWFVGARYEPSLGQGVHAEDEHSREHPFYLTGCALFASSEVWNLVGLLDERFFLNFEDLEWSRRAVARGVELAVVERSTVLHAVSESISRIGSLSTYLFARNGMMLSRSRLQPKAVDAWPFAWESVLRPHARAVRERQPGAIKALLLASIGMYHGWRGRPIGPPSARVQLFAQRRVTEQ